MKLGLIDADLLFHKKARFPNLALMKIAAKAKRDGAEAVLVLNESDALDCDALSVSKVFTETKEPDFLTRFKGAITRGGTGYFYDAAPPLDDETEHIKPDYSIYAPFVATFERRPPYLDFFDRAAIGFTTRGCFRRCPFCVNRNKERVERWARVEEFDHEKAAFITLLDDNIFGFSGWSEVFAELKATNKPFHFRQGLDVRLMTPEKARVLNESRYKGEIQFAFDNIADAETIREKLEVFREFCPTKSATAYVLGGYYESGVAALDSALTRCEILAEYNVKPYIMRFKSVYKSEFSSIWSGLAAWCNQPRQWKKRNFFEVNARRSQKAVDDARRLLPITILKRLEANIWESKSRLT